MKRQFAAVLVAATALTTTACGGNAGSSGSGASGGELQTVTMGIAAVAPAGVFQVGVDQGFFKAEGLQLEIKMVTSGAAVIPGVLAQNPQFSTSNPIAILTARDKGLGIKIIGMASSDKTPPAKGNYGVVVPKGSSITSLNQLAGKKVAVNALKGLGDFTVSEAVRKAGGDASQIQFVEIPFPDMVAALENGRVEAVWCPEPYLTKLVATGTLLGYTTQESVPGLASYTITSEALEKSNPDLVAKFKRALDKTQEYGQAHTDEVLASASKLTKLPIDVLKKAGMEDFGTDLKVEQFKQAAQIMQQRGWIKDAQADAAAALPSS